MDRQPEVIAIGEILWDVIGTERHLGGAPFNFAVHCRHLGARSAIVSRVGQDELGDEIVARARDLGVDGSLIQRDAAHPTGQVQVTLRAGGQPTFDIRSPAAYDHLAATPEAKSRVAAAGAIYFGTLAQRHSTARQAITALLEAASHHSGHRPLIVCDLNLRPPHYADRVIVDALARCDLLKLNDDELGILQRVLGWEGSDQDAFLRHLIETYDLALVCVTLGARGCILRTPQERVASPSYACSVVDTVGAGDGFAAALVTSYLAGRPLEAVAERANLMGAYIATQRGATPPVTAEALTTFAARTKRAPEVTHRSQR